MITHFWLCGLSAPESFTCRTLDGKENIFWVKNTWKQDRYKALFKWAKNSDFWNSLWVARIKCDGLYPDGTPINPKLLTIREEKIKDKKRKDVYD